MAKAEKLLYVGAGAAAVVLASRFRNKLPKRGSYKHPSVVRFHVDCDTPVQQYAEVGDIIEWRTFDGAVFDYVEVEQEGLLLGISRNGNPLHLSPDPDNGHVVRARILRMPDHGGLPEIRVKIFLQDCGPERRPVEKSAGATVGHCQGCY